jgi:hypothetical protein
MADLIYMMIGKFEDMALMSALQKITAEFSV